MMQSPLTWFTALPNSARLTVLGAVLSALDDIDPGLEQATGIWQAGKTVRLEARLSNGSGGVLELPLHLSVQSADIRLLRALRSRVGAGSLTFETGRAVDQSGATAEAIVASLGAGAVVVKEAHGELVFALVRAPAASVPVGLTEGQPSPFPPLPGDGFLLTLFEGSLVIVGGYRGLRRPEVRAARNDPITLGLAKASESLLIVGMRIPELLDGWADLPFSLAIEKPDRRQWPPPAADGTMMIPLVLEDSATRTVRVVRGLHMGAAFTGMLHDLMDGQMDAMAGYEREDYLREVAQARRRWPSPNDLAKDFIVVERAGGVR